MHKPTTSQLHSGGSIALAMGVMSVAAYAFTMLAARLLGPNDYGALAAVMNLLLVVNVASLALQATAARRVSHDPDHVAQLERTVLRVSYVAAVALGLVLLVLSPLITQVLRLDTIGAAIALAVAAVPLTVMGGQAGVLQGERRWTPLAWIYVAAGVPRLVIGTALLLWQPSETNAMIAVALGCFVPALVGWWALRDVRTSGPRSEHHAGRKLVLEGLHNSQALLAFFMLSNVDIVIARQVLSGYESGLYAAGLIVTKVVLFLPQFVVVVAFPAMATPAQRRRVLLRSLAGVTGLGLLAVVATYLLSSLALFFVGGNEFSEVQGSLWLFALIGSALAVIQVLVYSVLARQGRKSILAVWVALVAVVLLGLGVDTVAGLAAVVIGVDVALAVVLALLSLAATGRPVADPEEALVPGVPAADVVDD